MKATTLCAMTLSCLLSAPAWAQDEFPSLDAGPSGPPDGEYNKDNNPESGSFGKTDFDSDVDVRPNPDALGSEDPSFLFGPTVQIGFPHPLTYGLEAIYEKTISFGFSLGQYTLKVDPAEIKIQNSEIHARWHPFSGSFFLGAAYGKQTLTGKAEDDLQVDVAGQSQTVPTSIKVDIDNGYVTPHIGWFAVYYTGLVLSFELGAQIPLSPSADVTLDTSSLSAAQRDAVLASDEYKDLKKKADDTAKLLGQKTVPYITLFRLGYFF
jgi:hypothetical protein